MFRGRSLFRYMFQTIQVVEMQPRLHVIFLRMPYLKEIQEMKIENTII